MKLEVMLLVNSFLLVGILAVLLSLYKRNGYHPESSDKVKEDIKKIKDQINGK